MATVSVTTNPFLVVAADTNDNILDFATALNSLLGEPQREVFIQITVGSFKFSVGAVVAGTEPAYTVDEKLILTVTDALKLHFKATTAADAFKLFV